MRCNQLFTKTQKQAPKDEASVNAVLLARAGYIDKSMAGVYSYLPLGWRVLNKISDIIREEMNALGAVEVLMPTLQPKEILGKTGRWDKMREFMYQFKDASRHDIGLGATHEEAITEIVRKHIFSYKDLPASIYQIQNKFRHELRAKSGLLRGREFLMKDLYSFHASEKDFQNFYKKVAEAYRKIFSRIGLETYYTEGSGGVFSPFSHEFMVKSEAGEDVTLICPNCGFAQNIEISKLKEGDTCPSCRKGKMEEFKTIEVGNIFPLGTKYSQALDFLFSDEKGIKKSVIMGSYGIGVGRLMATVVETSHDKNGIIWPESVAPFKIYLINLAKDKKQAEKIYNDLTKHGVEVLLDDRDESAGIKFSDADLLGIPWRVVVSEKTLTKGSAEVKKRTEEEGKLVKINRLLDSPPTGGSLEEYLG